MDETPSLILEAMRQAQRARSRGADRDDLVQETLVRLFEHSKKDPGRAELRQPSGLIRAILNRVRIDWWRKQKRVELLPSPSSPCDDADPFDQAAWVELRQQIREAVENLPPPQREVVCLRYYDGKTFREIAQLQGVSINTTLGRMHLAMKTLRGHLHHHGASSTPSSKNHA